MKQRIPNTTDIKKTIFGMLQSSAFLSTNASAFFMFVCILRNLLGKFTCGTLTFYPAFLSSLAAILIERPVRRPLLSLYVANNATETLWRMLESRGYVSNLPNGQVLIFGISVSILLFVYRLGMHKGVAKDSLFDILKMFVGKTEEGPIRRIIQASSPSELGTSHIFYSCNGFVHIYSRFREKLKSKHVCCPHKGNCAHYAVMGGIRPLAGGIGLQILLKLVLSIKKVVQLKLNVKKVFLNRSTIRLGVFLGGFSFVYKASILHIKCEFKLIIDLLFTVQALSCLLRHAVGQDHALLALPAGLIASTAFFQYPDTTVALYVMWKMAQVR